MEKKYNLAVKQNLLTQLRQYLAHFVLPQMHHRLHRNDDHTMRTVLSI